MDGASIYIPRCADGSFYTGLTRRSVAERVSEQTGPSDPPQDQGSGATATRDQKKRL